MPPSSVASYTGAKSPTSSVAKPLVASNHKVGITQSYKVLVHNEDPKQLAFSARLFLSACIRHAFGQETVDPDYQSTLTLTGMTLSRLSVYFIGSCMHGTPHLVQSIHLVRHSLLWINYNVLRWRQRIVNEMLAFRDICIHSALTKLDVLNLWDEVHGKF